MSTDIVVSYDGSSTDDDGLALGKMLASAGASLALAYVRHSREFDAEREQLAQHDAERRLAHGSSWIGIGGAHHIVVHPSTPEGLRRLAAAEQAKVVVFGSDYRTPPGQAEPGATAQGLLEEGSVAVAVAAAGLRLHPDDRIATIASFGAADAAAAGLAESLGAQLVADTPDADLLVIGSDASAPPGRIRLGGAARARLNQRRGSVLVLPAGARAVL
jgi:nucleotide-binding universal stress UspA family protein